MGVLHRLSALFLSLVLLGGNVAVCAGWAASAEARMACCADPNCPMHEGKSHHSIGEQVVSQAQADACCAASEGQQSNESAPTFLSLVSSAVLGAGVVVPDLVPALVARDAWRTVLPIPIAPTPKYVLLSVFLV